MNFRPPIYSRVLGVVAVGMPWLSVPAHAHEAPLTHLHFGGGTALLIGGLLAFPLLLGAMALLLRRTSWSWLPVSAAILLFSTLPASAHHVMDTGRHPALGGFTLPFHGADHLLAMMVVGLFAATTASRRWEFPLGFLGFMVIGMVLGFARVPIPLVETGIWISVVAFGLILAVLGKMPSRVVAWLTAGFGIFHGYACGADMPNAWSPWSFGAGLVACTILLIAAGFLIGRLLSRWDDRRGVRVAGALTAIAMVAILLISLFSVSSPAYTSL